MTKLFAVMLGGRAERCNIELHDVVFVVGDSLEKTYSQLVAKWFGSPKRVHIDSVIELNYVDNYEIILSTTKPEDALDKKLYFVNFGAYKDNYFGEFHEYKFYVASSENEMLRRAKKELCVSLFQQHCDDKLIVDNITEIHNVDQYYIHLKPSDDPEPLVIKSFYHNLNQKTLKVSPTA